MFRKLMVLFYLLVTNGFAIAQLVNVRADYNGFGDCIFNAINNAKVPMYLHINFADIENTSFNEPLPYVKLLSPGFNDLFTLQRYPGADVPRFNYEIKVFRSNPMAKIDLDYPYLIPLKEGTTAKVFDVKDIDGFWGNERLDSWVATGFQVEFGTLIYACRNGLVVEIVENVRSGDSHNWYHTWTNSVTVLQEDGSLICYHNVKVNSEEIELGQKIYAGQKIGKVINEASELILLIFHDSILNDQLSFIIPQFVNTKKGNTGILNSVELYNVYHPYSVKAMEMSKKEQRKILGKQNSD